MSNLNAASSEIQAIHQETDPVKVESMISRIFDSKLELADDERAELRKACQHRDSLLRQRRERAAVRRDNPAHD